MNLLDLDFCIYVHTSLCTYCRLALSLVNLRSPTASRQLQSFLYLGFLLLCIIYLHRLSAYDESFVGKIMFWFDM